jgi:hypothetical protein
MTDLVETLTLKINIHLYKERERIKCESSFYFSLIYKEVQGYRRIRSEFKEQQQQQQPRIEIY